MIGKIYNSEILFFFLTNKSVSFSCRLLQSILSAIQLLRPKVVSLWWTPHRLQRNDQAVHHVRPRRPGSQSRHFPRPNPGSSQPASQQGRAGIAKLHPLCVLSPGCPHANPGTFDVYGGVRLVVQRFLYFPAMGRRISRGRCDQRKTMHLRAWRVQVNSAISVRRPKYRIVFVLRANLHRYRTDYGLYQRLVLGIHTHDASLFGQVP